MSPSISRLSKELKDAQTNGEPDIHLELYDANAHGTATCASGEGEDGSMGRAERARVSSAGADLFSWHAILQGPPDSPFEGGKYHLILRVPSDYPMVPPTAAFITRVFHPNVEFATGKVCLDILKTRWSPAWTLRSVCRAILNLLAEPEPDSPFNCDAGNLVRAGDMEGYRSMVRMYAIMDAGAPPFEE